MERSVSAKWSLFLFMAVVMTAAIGVHGFGPRQPSRSHRQQRNRRPPLETGRHQLRRTKNSLFASSSVQSAAESDEGVAITEDAVSFTTTTTIKSSSGGSSRNNSNKTVASLTFPSYVELMNLEPGDFVASEPFEVAMGNGNSGSSDDNGSSSTRTFRVKLFPRGGGHGVSSVSSNTGFGMAYKVLSPLTGRPEERVGMYLQYLPPKGSDGMVDDKGVDAIFALRLKGRQRQGVKRFDVEWRAGMRFVSLEASSLAKGCANDFGAHLMQTQLLPEFLGIDRQALDDPTPVIAEVEITLPDTQAEMQSSAPQFSIVGDPSNESKGESRSFFASLGQDIRYQDERRDTHDGNKVRVGKVVVPILSKLSQRPRMFEVGAYPGVEYRILRILKDGQERFTSCPGADYELKPIYPLVSELERPWPVTVNEREIPRLYTPSMYNAVSAIGSLATAVTGLLAAFVVSQAVSFYFIPSKSMAPTLQVGDVLLVDKVSPRLFRQHQRVDDIILFSPPSKLQEVVANNGGKLSSRDLFVKRIAALPGDHVSVREDGEVMVNGKNVVKAKRDLCEEEPLRLIEKYIDPREEETIEVKEVFVMGDCSSVSVDSRVWGSLSTDEIVGKPIARIWPLERMGWIK